MGGLTAGARRVGVFGGTFDPVHVGHLIIAEEARHALGLDAVLFVPARRSPLKAHEPRADDAARVAMLEGAIAGQPAFTVHRVDLDRPHPSYTVDTLAHLRAELDTVTDWWFVLGADALAELPAWHAPGRVVALARLAVFDRPGAAPDMAALAAAVPGLAGRVDRVPAPLVGISATDLRQRVAAGRPIRYQVPAAVEAYVHAHGLYGSGGAPDAGGRATDGRDAGGDGTGGRAPGRGNDR